jgi:predicted HD phosphohydrolase
VRRALHLAAGFVRACWPFGPRPARDRWARTFLTGPEQACWDRSARIDRREGIRTARRFLARMPDAPAVLVACALLHDTGKRASGLGPYGRAVATAAGAVAGAGYAPLWVEREGFVRRAGTYLLHDEAGAQMLEVAGARPEVAAWARLHHRPHRWHELAFPPGAADALADADGEPVRRG